MKRTSVYTRFYQDKLAYRSVNGRLCKIYQIYKLTQISSLSSADLRQFFIISFADQPRDLSFLDLEILNLHHIHGCTINLDLSDFNHSMQIYFRVKYSFNTQTHAHPCTMIFFSLYRFSLCQYHESKPPNR